MRFRFTLTHEVEGSIEISEPDGWKDCTLKLERHEDFHSLIEYFDGSFIFYGDNGRLNGGLDFIKFIEITHGLDATILVDIDVTFDEVSYSNVFNGQYRLTDLEEIPNNKLRLPIIRDDFWAKFISRLDIPVDIKRETNLDDLPASNAQEVNIKLESQTIKAQFIGKFDEGIMFEDPGGDYLDQYVQVDPPLVILDEIEEKFSIGNATNPEKPVWIIEAKYAGQYTFDLRIEASKHSLITPGDNLDGTMKMFFQIGDQTPVEFTLANHGGGGTEESSSYTYQAVHILAAGTIVRVYGFINATISGAFDLYIWGETNPALTLTSGIIPSGVTNPSYFNIVALTVFPQTNSSGFLIHDLAASIVEKTTGVSDSFHSPYLGGLLTTARQYAENGCAWAYAGLKGLQLRQYTLTEKPFFMSFNQWWRGVNPILNLSLRYDEIDGNQVISVGKKEEEYDDSEGPSINFSNIRNITRKYDHDRIFNKYEVGYERWQSEDISGIDDPQSRRTYANVLKKSGKGITLFSEWVGASLAIERTRRESRVKSSDYKYDNETFIIALNPDLQEESPDVSPDLLQFMPELDENFVSVNNLLSPETRYNLRITPARNLLRWQNYLQGCLQDYPDSEIKFVSGEGNYDLTTEMDENSCQREDFDGELLDEKGNIPVTDDFIHLPLLYEAELPMDWSDYVQVRNNRRKPIGISQTESGHVSMFIKTLDYKPVKGTCSMLLWSKEYLDLSVIEDHTPMQECMPLSDACEQALTDELGNILTDELGVCITE